ncbi:MAG: hypothetical protein ACFFDQ_09710 [Candidatus Thorarchaeota archaeon]
MGESEISYHTPLILRTGFLHCYKRTAPIIIGWLVLNFVIYWQMNVLENLVWDWWTYLYLPIFLLVVHIARTAVSGYDDLFGIFDPNFEKRLKLYKSLDLPSDTLNQERIRTIFIEDRFYQAFKKQVRQRLFGGIERYFILAVIIASPIISYFYVNAYLFVGVYGAKEPVIWLYVYIATNLIIGFWFAFGLASLVWIIFSMIMSISRLEKCKKGFKVTNYLQLLKGEEFESLDRVMGYDTFYEQTTAIGSFIYRLTLRALIIMVVYALNLIFVSFLNQLNLGLGVYSIGLFIVGLAIILFTWPQVGLHGLLNRRKKEILRELILKKDKLDTEVIFMTSKVMAAERTESTLNEAAFKREASDRVSKIYSDVKERSTWGFEISTVIKYLGTSAIPLISSLLSTLLGF